MDNDKMQSMDPYILLSWSNMKLRDEFESLEMLCEEYDLAESNLIEKLRAVGYVYSNINNQFISREA